MSKNWREQMQACVTQLLAAGRDTLQAIDLIAKAHMRRHYPDP